MPVSNTPRAKTERLLNLTMGLLSTRRALPKAEIRRRVEAYRGVESDEAFDRMFERDKDDLRALGIPLVTEHIGGAFDDEQGYRIDRRDYAVPDIDLTTDERAVVGLAARAWSHAAMAPSAAAAWRKVSALEGDDQDQGAEGVLEGVELRLGGAEPAFLPLQEAVSSGRSVTFEYTKGDGTRSARRVDPWALTSWRGRWYLTGHDLDREGSRVFRLGRITSEVRLGRPVTVPAPDDLDPTHAVRELAGVESPAEEAMLAVRQGRGHSLRRRGESVSVADAPDGWDVLRVTYASLHPFADELAAAGADVVVREPAELADAVRDRLAAVVAAHGAAR